MMNIDRSPRLLCRHSSGATDVAASAQTKTSTMPKFSGGYELNLPPSIPVSLDGEEGAYAYSQNLLQSISDAKPECYQPPPNITIHRRLSGDCDVLGAPFRSSYSSVESHSKSQLTEHFTSMDRSLYSERTATVTSRSCSPRKGALPAVPYQVSKESSSSSWRECTSVPETEVSGRLHQQQHQPRSSSADSVRRLVKLKRFLIRKIGSRVPTLRQEPLMSPSTKDGVYERLEGEKGDSHKLESSPWDLPPNYVDMIFSRDPVTNENQSDVVDNGSKLDLRKVFN